MKQTNHWVQNNISEAEKNEDHKSLEDFSSVYRIRVKSSRGVWGHKGINAEEINLVLLGNM